MGMDIRTDQQVNITKNWNANAYNTADRYEDYKDSEISFKNKSEEQLKRDIDEYFKLVNEKYFSFGAVDWNGSDIHNSSRFKDLTDMIAKSTSEIAELANNEIKTKCITDEAEKEKVYNYMENFYRTFNPIYDYFKGVESNTLSDYYA